MKHLREFNERNRLEHEETMRKNDEMTKKMLFSRVRKPSGKRKKYCENLPRKNNFTRNGFIKTLGKKSYSKIDVNGSRDDGKVKERKREMSGKLHYSRKQNPISVIIRGITLILH